MLDLQGHGALTSLILFIHAKIKSNQVMYTDSGIPMTTRNEGSSSFLVAIRDFSGFRDYRKRHLPPLNDWHYFPKS